MFFEQRSASLYDVFCFNVEETNGPNELFQTIHTEIQNCLRRVGHWVEYLRGLVDTDVGCLGRQNNGNQKFEWAAVSEFGSRMWVQRPQA